MDRLNPPRGVEFVTADVTKQREVRRALVDIDGCFHLAAVASVERSRREWLRSHKVNLAGTITVFEEVCRAQKALGRPLPIVYASSAAVYGNASEIPISEGKPRPVRSTPMPSINSAANCTPPWPAAYTQGCEASGCGSSMSTARDKTLIRLTRESSRSFASKFCKGRRSRSTATGSQIRDFVYVRDAVNALRQGMESNILSPQVYNVCTGIGTSICQLGAIMARMRGVPFRRGMRRHAPATCRCQWGTRDRRMKC